MNIYIILLLFGNLCIGLGPLFVNYLPQYSPFTIGFTRFLMAGIIEALIIIIYLVRLHWKLHNAYGKKKSMQMIVRSFKEYFWGNNTRFMGGTRQIWYTIWLGLLLVGIVVPYYYLSFQIIGVVLSTILINVIPIIVIAVVSWVQKRENMDAFKVIYLFLLLAGVITIGLSYETDSSHGELSVMGLFVMILTSVAFIAYSLSINRDALVRRNILLIPKTLEPLPNTIKPGVKKDMAMLRAFFKLFAIHITGAIILIIEMILLQFTGSASLLGEEARQFIQEDLIHLEDLMFDPFLLGISTVSTVFPYMIQVLAVKNWPRFTLGFDAWNSILTVMQPLIGLYIGFFVWGEAIQADYILFTTIFLIVSIVIRYLHENTNFRLVLFRVRVKNKYTGELISFLKTIPEIFEINITLGKIGIIFHTNVRSVPRLFDIEESLKNFPGIIEIKYYEEELIPGEN